MQPGIDYFIKCKFTGFSILDLWRDNANATYPQTLNGEISITASNAGSPGYWYFFYDWEVEGGPCVSPRSIVTAHIATGINDIENPVTYNLYPNPTTGVFTLNIHSPNKEDIAVSVYDIDGKIVYSELLNVKGEASKTFDFAGYSKGIYILKLLTNQKVYNEKLVID